MLIGISTVGTVKCRDRSPGREHTIVFTIVIKIKIFEFGGFGTAPAEGFDSPTNHCSVVYDANTRGSNPREAGVNRPG